MKRLSYICRSCLLATALQALPPFFSGIAQLALAVVLAVALWGVVWLRLYTNRRLRPEFAVLAVLPQLWHYALVYAGNSATPLYTPFWQNLFFFAWCGTAFVGIRALLCGPREERPHERLDGVLLFMSIITLAFCVSSWAGSVSHFSTH